MAKSKNYSIEFFRFFFMLMICFHHHNQEILQASYIGVEFYFILSGLFLYRSAIKPQAPGTIDFTLLKLKRFIPELLLVLPLALYAKFERDTPDFFYEHLSVYLADGVGIGGMFEQGANDPLWYISVLIWAGGLLYGILKYNRSLAIHIILPTIALFGGTYIVSRRFNLFDVVGFMPTPFVRGLAEMSMGILLSYFLLCKRELLISHRTIVGVLSVLGFCGFLAYALFFPMNPAFVFFCLILFVLGLFIPGTPFQRLFNHKCWEFFGSISLEMLLIHMPIINIFHYHSVNWAMSPLVKLGLLFAIIIASSILLHYLYQYLTKKLFG